jgi:hypothetical protein
MQSSITTEEVKKSEGVRVPSANLDCESFGKITLYVRSKKALVCDSVVTLPTFPGLLGPMVPHRERLRVYENVFDEEQLEAIQHSKTLAASLGIGLEVKDVSKSNAVVRFFMFLSRGSRLTTPSVSLDDEALYSLMKKQDQHLVSTSLETQLQLR